MFLCFETKINGYTSLTAAETLTVSRKRHLNFAQYYVIQKTKNDNFFSFAPIESCGKTADFRFVWTSRSLLYGSIIFVPTLPLCPGDLVCERLFHGRMFCTMGILRSFQWLAFHSQKHSIRRQFFCCWESVDKST